MPHTYIGWNVRQYPAWLDVTDPEQATTLTAVPGNSYETRAVNPGAPDVPGDGLWVEAQPRQAADPAPKPKKTADKTDAGD